MYLQPHSLAEALQLRAQHPQATVIAGGTRVLGQPVASRPLALLDLATAGLSGVAATPAGLRIGALTPIAALLDLPFTFGALIEAARTFRPAIVREQATLGGNVCAGGSMLAPLALLCARAELASIDGMRTVPILAVDLAPHELLLAVLVPVPVDETSGYASLRRTPLGPAIAAVALAAGRAGIRISVQSVEPTVVLRGPWPDSPDLQDRLAASLHGQSDARAGAVYRQAMAGVLAKRLLVRLQAAVKDKT